MTEFLLSSLLRQTRIFADLSSEISEELAQRLSLKTIASAAFLVQEGDADDALYIVVSGQFQVSRIRADAISTESIVIGIGGPGEVFGALGLLTGHPAIATVQALENSIAAVLSANDFDEVSAAHPEGMASALFAMAASVDSYQIASAIEESPILGELSPEARRNIAASCKRIDLRAGETLFREGQPADALYLVLSGRVRLQREPNASPTNADISDLDPGSVLLAELGKGDLLGELSLLTAEPRSSTAIAVRDSHLARLDLGAFDRVVADYPSEMLRIFARQLAGRLREQNRHPGYGRKVEGGPPVAITVLPLTAREQAGGASEFAAELVRQLSVFGPTLHLTRDIIDRVFRHDRRSPTNRDTARPGLSHRNAVAERRMVAWLEDLERLYRHIVYEADYQSGIEESLWTNRCLRQADTLLVVAGDAADPSDSQKTMVRLTGKALPSVKTTLVLLHSAGPGRITGTRIWKKSLGFAAHEHVRCDPNGNLHSPDVARLARALNGQSVGLVLGGGFALGLAHIGVVDAMRDLGIPIDYVGGTSMGAIIAAAAAQEFNHDQMLEVMDRGCAQALKGDYTLPLLSLLSGKKVAVELGNYLRNLDIEDLWLPYFAISASLVQAKMVVHRKGSALNSVLASCRAPGMFPPLGWEGDVLVDGGLVNNIPADVMRQSIGSGTVIAADVSPEAEFTAGAEFGLVVSGWHIARRNFSPFRRQQKLGTLRDVLMRLIRLGGVSHKLEIRANADLYMAIPLQQFSIRDFQRGEELAAAGYTHAKQELQRWIDENGRPWLGQSHKIARTEPTGM